MDLCNRRNFLKVLVSLPLGVISGVKASSLTGMLFETKGIHDKMKDAGKTDLPPCIGMHSPDELKARGECQAKKELEALRCCASSYFNHQNKNNINQLKTIEHSIDILFTFQVAIKIRFF